MKTPITLSFVASEAVAGCVRLQPRFVRIIFRMYPAKLKVVAAWLSKKN